MFPFWLEFSSAALEPLAVMTIAVLAWMFQLLCPRGG